MRTIILFNDNSPEALNAGDLALSIAQKVKADLLILNLCKAPQFARQVKSQVAAVGSQTAEYENDLVQELADSIGDDDFRPVINELDASSYTEKDICELVVKKDIWMLIKGAETHTIHEAFSAIDVQAVINHVACPLLLVPDNYEKRNFENITYTLDMRYCRTAVLKFLAELARMFDANLVIEHFSAKDLPHLNNNYARSLFESEVASKISYRKVFFNNIKERNLDVAVEVMVNDLHADLLALVNHRFHFEELFGRSIKNVLPEHILVPVMIFPL